MPDGPDEFSPPPEAAAPASPAAPLPALPESPSPAAIRLALKGGRAREVVELLLRMAPVRRAELFVRLRPAEQKTILGAASPELAASILADCDSATLAKGLVAMDLAAFAPAFRLIPPDNLADIVLRLPPRKQDDILAQVDPGLRDDVRKLMSFDPDTAGGLMTTRYLSVPDVVTLGMAIDLLRSSGKADTASYVYIVDAYGRLAGVAPLRSLLLGNSRRPIGSIMIRDVTRLRTGAPRDEIVALFNQYHFVSLPVVDEKDRLVGIVTGDDVMAAMRERQQEVLHAVTGADAREALKETFAAARGRLPWMTATIAGGLGCAAIGLLFQATLHEIVMLAIFTPVVLAVGESVGAQTATVVLATLAGGRVTQAGLLRFLWKEWLIGLSVAAFAAVVVSTTSLLWHGNPRLGIFIGLAVLVCVTWAALLGGAVPGLMRRFRINPEIAGGPLVLAISDLSTLLLFYGGAALLIDDLR